MGGERGISRRAVALVLSWLAVATAVLDAAARADDNTDPLRHLKYRLVGPAAGGRICRVAGVPGDPRTYYAATASSGIWKSTDGGIVWKPIFDDQPDSSVGSIAVSPSDPNVIYAGSGEANIRNNVVLGGGIYKSLDAGRTWQHAWKQAGQIGQMIVHPRQPEIAFAAVLGNPYRPNPERGVYRTRDGGRTWQRVLYLSDKAGAADICQDATNPHILFASLWQTRRRPWELTSGGEDSGLYMSRDGGDTWKPVRGAGLPVGPWGKVGVAVAPSDGRRVYALIEAHEGGLFRSDDGGFNWKLANGHRALRQRAWYYMHVTVDPRNPDVVWVPQVPLLKSIDGGKTFRILKGLHHGDHHDIWIDPQNTQRIIEGNDGGVDMSVNGGETWHAPALPICQMYRINVDRRMPYHISGTMQDIGCYVGPSNSLRTIGIVANDWQPVGGGETGYTAHDPRDPTIIYAGEYGGYISRFDAQTGEALNVSVYPANPSGHAAKDMKYRFRWPAPLLLSPHAPHDLYHAGNVLFRSRDRGHTWAAISPDLTRNDKSKQQWSGGPITGDNTTAEYYGTLSAIAVSPRKADVLWVGSDDGRAHFSQNDGKTWTEVTGGLPGLPEWATIVCIEPSRHDPAAAFLVAEAHLLGDTTPLLYKTANYGKTWQRLSRGLEPNEYLHVVREDPVRRGLLFLGTQRGVRVSFDDGLSWQPLRLNLPTVPVHDLVIHADNLVVGTHGRSVWILDDLAALRRVTQELLSADVRLLPIAPAARWRYSYARRQPAVGRNPEVGARVAYYLRHAASGEVKLEILDGENRVIRTLSSQPPPLPPADPLMTSEPDDPPPRLSTQGGLNVFVWNLHHEGAKRIPAAPIDAGNPAQGPLALPGAYAARLSVTTATGVRTLTEKLQVLPDPRGEATPEELRAWLTLSLAVRDDLDQITRHVEQIRRLRTQLVERNQSLAEPRFKPLVDAAQKFAQSLDQLEAELHNPGAKIVYDILAQKGGAQLYSQYGILHDWLSHADAAPTQGQREVFAEHHKKLLALAERLRKLLANDLAELAALARQLQVPEIVP